MKHGFPTASCVACVKSIARTPPWKTLHRSSTLSGTSFSVQTNRATANFVRQHFWARGYFVSTVGRDEQVIREYIRHQEAEDHRLEQMQLWR